MKTETAIRPVEARDEQALARVLRAVMVEYGALDTDAPDADEEVGAMTAAYGGARSVYLVAERGGVVLGGAGIAPFSGQPARVCVLRKMYLADEARGLGLGRALLDACLDAARTRGYRVCYLETMPGMTTARALYEAAGFVRRDDALAGACASRCSAYYEREL